MQYNGLALKRHQRYRHRDGLAGEYILYLRHKNPLSFFCYRYLAPSGAGYPNDTGPDRFVTKYRSH